MTDLLDSILCSRGLEAIFHNYKCVMGICSDYGPTGFRWCRKELSNEILIPIKMFETVDTTYEGKVCKRKDLCKRQRAEASMKTERQKEGKNAGSMESLELRTIHGRDRERERKNRKLYSKKL